MFPFARYEIEGESMIPAYQPGDRVLVFRWGTVKSGDTVIFCKNGMTMVKRAVAKEGDRWIMKGDNWKRSCDSEDFGGVADEEIIGKVVATY
ncbi:S26 family signal peptidase [Candidatus Peregrinibacteria bacterium]|nr:S26 family signal peptidase [Candidatus Peregrinibacteria bacterium]